MVVFAINMQLVVYKVDMCYKNHGVNTFNIPT